MGKIKAIITGASGMVGKGVLLECLDNDQVEEVLIVNRRRVGIEHPKLKQVLARDFFDLSEITKDLTGYNACFFCLGASSAGMSEAEYTIVTYQLTLNFAKTLVRLNEKMVFCYVSGSGTDSKEKSRMMWARVKGRTENAIINLPFKDAYMFRPGMIQPLKGVRSKILLVNIFYLLMKPLFPLFKLFPFLLTDTSNIGLAMIHVVLKGHPIKHLSNSEINRVARGSFITKP